MKEVVMTEEQQKDFALKAYLLRRGIEMTDGVKVEDEVLEVSLAAAVSRTRVMIYGLLSTEYKKLSLREGLKEH
jgi:hypothetical protein